MYEAAQKAQTGDSLQLATTTNTQPSTPEDELETQLQEDEQDLLTTGRIYAEAKEFTRAAHLLLDCKSSKGKFMSIYFQFLVRFFFLSLAQTRGSIDDIFSRHQRKRLFAIGTTLTVRLNPVLLVYPVLLTKLPSPTPS